MTLSRILALAATLFVAIAICIVMAARLRYVTPQFALLALIALLGLYFGFGVLIAVHYLLRKLE